MTREAKVGIAAVAAVVGFIGWSVAEGVANRPKAVDVRTVVAPEKDAPVAVDRAASAEPSESPCCKDKSHHPADHANCKMKKTESAAPPQGDPAKCPYLSGRSASAPAGPASASKDAVGRHSAK